MDPPEETRAGNVERSARAVRPPSPKTMPKSFLLLRNRYSLKVKTKGLLEPLLETFCRTWLRSAPVRAMIRDSKSVFLSSRPAVLQAEAEEEVFVDGYEVYVLYDAPDTVVLTWYKVEEEVAASCV